MNKAEIQLASLFNILAKFKVPVENGPKQGALKTINVKSKFISGKVIEALLRPNIDFNIITNKTNNGFTIWIG